MLVSSKGMVGSSCIYPDVDLQENSQRGGKSPLSRWTSIKIEDNRGLPATLPDGVAWRSWHDAVVATCLEEGRLLQIPHPAFVLGKKIDPSPKKYVTGPMT